MERPGEGKGGRKERNKEGGEGLESQGERVGIKRGLPLPLKSLLINR